MIILEIILGVAAVLGAAWWIDQMVQDRRRKKDEHS